MTTSTPVSKSAAETLPTTAGAEAANSAYFEKYYRGNPDEYAPIYANHTPDELQAEVTRLEGVIKDRKTRLAEVEPDERGFLERVIAARTAKLGTVRRLLDKATRTSAK